MIHLVLVDFDDTLVDTAPRFQAARRQLFQRLTLAGFSEELAQTVHQNEVEPFLLEHYGLGPRRLEPSFTETYLRLCALTGAAPDLALADECGCYGRAVVGTPPVLPGALAALRELARRHHTVLFTAAADAEYQLGCIREAGVLDVLPLEQVRICARKTVDEFRRVLSDYGVAEAHRACMIGNSIRSDLNPALAAGARAILVDCAQPWEYDVVAPIAPDYLRAPSFADAVSVLLNGGLVGSSQSGVAQPS